MTTPNNNPTRPAAIAHEGQTAAGTNQRRKYEVNFDLAEHSIGSVIVEATSPEEARQIADQIYIEDVKDWQPVMDEMTIESVEIADEGQSND
jgi:hypothetical protein